MIVAHTVRISKNGKQVSLPLVEAIKTALDIDSAYAAENNCSVEYATMLRLKGIRENPLAEWGV